MSKGINKVIIIGNLGKDPQTRELPNGSFVTNIVLATSESWKDKNSGENVERTEWHRVVLFNKLAEIASQYLKKGAKIYIEGSLKTRKWQDNLGQDRFSTEIIGNEMQMLGKTQAPKDIPRDDSNEKKIGSIQEGLDLIKNTRDIDDLNDIPF